MARVTLEDVAREANLSAATVDRVLNRRPGVRARTIERVEAAISKLGYERDALAARLARRRSHRFALLLPRGENTFMRGLAAEARAAASRLERERVELELLEADVFDGPRLAGALTALSPLEVDGVIAVALDHPAVQAAIDDLAAASLPVVTLVSDVPASRRIHYVGIDNVAAGRTAATLLGRFSRRRSGKVGLIAGSMALRDHAERALGFGQVLSSDFQGLELLPVREGQDDHVRVRAAARKLIAETPDLVGLYNVGAGNRGIITALEESGRSGRVVFIAHELTEFTRRALASGTVDAVINQDAGHEVRSAVRVLLAAVEGTPIVEGQERIRIDIFLRDNMP